MDTANGDSPPRCRGFLFPTCSLFFHSCGSAATLASLGSKGRRGHQPSAPAKQICRPCCEIPCSAVLSDYDAQLALGRDVFDLRREESLLGGMCHASNRVVGSRSGAYGCAGDGPRAWLVRIWPRAFVPALAKISSGRAE